MSRLVGQTLYIDCFSGLSGDMMLGALVDLGVPVEVIVREVERLGYDGWSVRTERVLRGGLTGTKFQVCLDGDPRRAHDHVHAHAHDHSHAHDHGHDHSHAHDHEHSHDHSHDHSHAHDHSHDHAHDHSHDHAHEHSHDHSHDHSHAHDHSHDHAHDHAHDHSHRPYAEIRARIVSRLSGDVQLRALAMFDRIAQVEAALHGVSVEDVAFHEVGALDSIVDLVGTAAALAWLRPARILARVVPLGSGTVRTAHGRLPVPAPATLALLEGATIEAGPQLGELTTPTGAAILAAHVSTYGPLPPLRLLGTGWGAGSRELPGQPNLVRLIVGEPLETAPHTGASVHSALRAAPSLVELAVNLDDLSPQLAAPLIDQLLGAGALDAWFVPITMKKGRPGLCLHALGPPEAEGRLVELLFAESSTLGVRIHEVAREVLERRIVDVETPFGPVAVKLGGRRLGPGASLSEAEILNVQPEFESCRQRAAAHGAPMKRVWSAALVAAEQWLTALGAGPTQR